MVFLKQVNVRVHWLWLFENKNVIICLKIICPWFVNVYKWFYIFTNYISSFHHIGKEILCFHILLTQNDMLHYPTRD